MPHKTKAGIDTANNRENRDQLDICRTLDDLRRELPGMVRDAIHDEFEFRKHQLQPLSHAARLIGISPTTAHNYKRAGLLAVACDRFGKIVPLDLLTIHLQQ